MRISQKLPQFKDRRTLIIVAGKVEAKFIEAYNGEIRELTHCKSSKPDYSDNEGYFETRGRGFWLGSGSVREVDDDDLINHFMVLFKKTINELSHGSVFDSIFILAPTRTLKPIQEVLPDQLARKISFTKEGNYTKEHFFDILSIINQEYQNNRVVPISEEAEKILKKGEMDR